MKIRSTFIVSFFIIANLGCIRGDGTDSHRQPMSESPPVDASAKFARKIPIAATCDDLVRRARTPLNVFLAKHPDDECVRLVMSAAMGRCTAMTVGERRRFAMAMSDCLAQQRL